MSRHAKIRRLDIGLDLGDSPPRADTVTSQALVMRAQNQLHFSPQVVDTVTAKALLHRHGMITAKGIDKIIRQEEIDKDINLSEIEKY